MKGKDQFESYFDMAQQHFCNDKVPQMNNQRLWKRLMIQTIGLSLVQLRIRAYNRQYLYIGWQLIAQPE